MSHYSEKKPFNIVKECKNIKLSDFNPEIRLFGK